MKIRKAYNAGKFYPGTKTEIIDLIDFIYDKEKKNINYSLSGQNIIGGIVPHAGYNFSGYQAIHFFEIIKNSKQKFDTIFIINPSHTGYGDEVSLDDNDYWENPLGMVETDKDFYKIMNIPVSETANKYEHSGELMLPFLQYKLSYDFKIVPITIRMQNFDNANKVAKEIYTANKSLNKNILLIASSDFSHYLAPEIGKYFDNMVLNEINNLNSKKLFKTVIRENISVCGYGPIMTLIEYSKLITKNVKIKILKRGHSGEVMQSRKVVDYISILFYH
ncbi:MAG: AmmeMemoRadiSam system protein B [Bacteroidales bacterium]|nr:AmmeMemoRadiSam system protein B [Bacteroidales bacterium]